MAFINLENDLPGIRGPMAYSPETGKALNELAEIFSQSFVIKGQDNINFKLKIVLCLLN